MCKHHENIEEDKFGYQWGRCKLCDHVTEYGLIHDMLVKIDAKIHNRKGMAEILLTSDCRLPYNNRRGIIIC